MRITEFAKVVESYGVSVPAHIRTGQVDDWFYSLLALSKVGSGHQRIYTNDQVRVLVAWQLLGRLLGKSSASSRLRREAAHLIADAKNGFVVLANRSASWSLDPPVNAVRSGVAVVMPVPRWKKTEVAQ
jgi:hypothetical protein